MSSNWDRIKRKAAQEFDGAEQAAHLRATEAREAKRDIAQKSEEARDAYILITQSFCRQVRGANPMPGAKTYTFSRGNDSLLAFWHKRVDLVFVPDVGLSWVPYTYPLGLLVGVDIGPMLTAELSDEPPLRFYKAARKSWKDVDGLSEMLSQATGRGHDPWRLVEKLLEGLAAWSARNWRELDLDVPRRPSK